MLHMVSQHHHRQQATQDLIDTSDP
jgi:hypothetical protein